MGKYVLAAVDDMFFASKIRATVEQLGLDVRFAKSAEDALEIFHAFFELNGRERIQFLNLSAAY